MNNVLCNFLDKREEEERIIGKEKDKKYSVLALFCEKDGKVSILFEKRAKNITQGGEVSFPGGRTEKNENCIETALRETFEEIGIAKDRIQKIRHYGKIVMPTGQLIDVQIGYIENFSMEEIKANPDEVEKVFLVPLDYFLENEAVVEKVMVKNVPEYKIGDELKIFPAKKLNLPEKYHKPWGRERKVYFYNYDGEIIWGITGEILYSLIDEIKKYY